MERNLKTSSWKANWIFDSQNLFFSERLRTMVPAFLNPLSEILFSELVNCTDFNDLIDIGVENIDEFSSAVKRILDSQQGILETFQVRLFCQGLENYLKDNLWRSSRLLSKEFVLLSEKYPVGFWDCILFIKKGMFCCCHLD